MKYLEILTLEREGIGITDIGAPESLDGEQRIAIYLQLGEHGHYRGVDLIARIGGLRVEHISHLPGHIARHHIADIRMHLDPAEDYLVEVIFMEVTHEHIERQLLREIPHEGGNFGSGVGGIKPIVKYYTKLLGAE